MILSVQYLCVLSLFYLGKRTAIARLFSPINLETVNLFKFFPQETFPYWISHKKLKMNSGALNVRVCAFMCLDGCSSYINI